MTRSRLVTALVVVAAASLFATTVTAYAWRALYDPEQFANRASAALQDRSVREAISVRITDEVVLPARPTLLAARPLVASAISAMVGGDAFASLFRRGVRDVHAALFSSEQHTVTLTLADAAIVLATAVRKVNPELAAELPAGERVSVLRRRSGDVVRLARHVRALTFLFGALTLAATAVALAASRDRRRTASQLGVAIVVAGAGIVAAEVLVRAVVLERVGDRVDRSAAGAVWDAFLGDLRSTGWLIAGAGAVVAAAAGSLVRPIEIEQPLRAAWRIAATSPERTALRAARGVALAVAGIVVIAEPQAVLRIAATLVGVYALYKGLEVLLRLTYRPVERPESRRRGARGVVVGLLAVLVVAGAAAVFAASGGAGEPAPAIAGCNERAALCDRPLDQITLPATHNSMSVPLPGWFAPLQEHPIAEQLSDGIRGLLLDTHYADRLPNGRTRTYFADSHDLRRAIAQDGVSEQSVKAAERLRSRIGFRGSGERGMYLCHTFCELGATPLASVLEDIHEFLATHPDDVLVVVNQDYVTPSDFVAAVTGAGLAPYAFTPPAGSDWPTLRHMIDDDRRLLLLAENHAGSAPWYQLTYERLTQETPFSFNKPAQLTDAATLAATCREHRGTAGAPLFLVNHWINTDPVPRPTNADIVNAYEPLLRRARECERIRHRRVNLLAVDFYRRGDLFRVVDALNG